MKIDESTHDYETWLASHTKLVEADLATKHRHMAQDKLLFLGATFYRWAQLWPEVCPTLASAPGLLAVGDLHIENFGTWRDIEGRLIWGVNDFDEAFTMPYTIDLIRLATSARLGIDQGHLAIGFKEACKQILKGYQDGLAVAGKPYVLAEHHSELRQMTTSELREPARFWQKMDRLPYASSVPNDAAEAIATEFPAVGLSYSTHTRVAGNGSLGHQRYVGIAYWDGAQISREAKALVPSAYAWAQGLQDPIEIQYQTVLDRSVRALDPCVKLRGSWLVRRLAPDCSRVELGLWPTKRDEKLLLYAMGREIANIHLGTPDAIEAVKADLAERPGNWVHQGAKAMADATRSDWKDWRRFSKGLNKAA